MTSVLLGKVTPSDGLAISGGNKAANYINPTPIEYMEALRQLYHTSETYISNAISNRISLSTEYEGNIYRFDIMMDDKIPTYANIMERVTELAKNGYLECCQGIAFPLSYNYFCRYSADLSDRLANGSKPTLTKTKRFHDAYQNITYYGRYVPTMKNLDIPVIANIIGDRRQSGINRVNDKLTIVCIDINEYPMHGEIFDESLFMDPHMLFIRSKDLNFKSKAVRSV